MMSNDGRQQRDLEVLLSYLLNKQLKSSEVIVALGISRSAYYDQKERGDLTSPNNLIAAARYYGLNPLELLVPYGHVALADARDFVFVTLGLGHDGAAIDPETEPAKRKGGTVLGRRGSDDSEHHFGPQI